MVDFSNCRSLSEMGRLLGYNYYNAGVKRKIIKVCKDNGIDPYKIIDGNNKMKDSNVCLNCGKEIKHTKKFCNSSCAASFNNKRRKHSDVTKSKIQNTLQTKYIDKIYIPYNLGQKNSDIFLSKLISKNLVRNPNNYEYVDEYIPYCKWKIRTCIVCGKEFTPCLTKSGKISKANTCSETCRHCLISNNSKKAMDIVMSEGRHQGWKSRNIISYPEKFWMEVLSNNNIEYKHNYPFGKYFLDFYIEIDDRKIDLEIDGKQHKYEDRHNSDIIRDKFVNSQNIEIYRIDWNTINTEDGKRIMKEKIEKFLKFIRQ